MPSPKNDIAAAFARFAGKTVHVEKKKHWKEEIYQASGDRPRARPSEDVYYLVERKRVYRIETQLAGKTYAGIMREASKRGLRVRFSVNGLVGGLNYDPSRVTIDLLPDDKRGYRVTSKTPRLG